MRLNKLHSDKRGAIYVLTGEEIDFEEITVFFTEQNFARGGCIHKLNDEHCVVLGGKIAFTIGEKTHLLHRGETITIPSNTPHYFISTTASLVMEWGTMPEEKKEKHLETRKIVDKINEKNN